MEYETIQVRIPSHPRYLQIIRGMMKRINHITGFSKNNSGHIILAVDEACSNIIKHSYMNDPKGKIELSVEIHQKELKIIITDYGKQQDIKQIKPKNMDDLKPGGRGIYILNKVMDSVEYNSTLPARNEISRNEIKMIKRRESGQGRIPPPLVLIIISLSGLNQSSPGERAVIFFLCLLKGVYQGVCGRIQ